MGTVISLRPGPMPATIPHPTISPAEAAMMPASERVYFLDSPESHIVAFQDFQRDLAREARNIETLRLMRAERRTGSRVL